MGEVVVLGISQVDLVRIPYESRGNVDLEQAKLNQNNQLNKLDKIEFVDKRHSHSF
jgi:hypothetical protein